MNCVKVLDWKGTPVMFPLIELLNHGLQCDRAGMELSASRSPSNGNKTHLFILTLTIRQYINRYLPMQMNHHQSTPQRLEASYPFRQRTDRNCLILPCSCPNSASFCRSSVLSLLPRQDFVSAKSFELTDWSKGRTGTYWNAGFEARTRVPMQKEVRSGYSGAPQVACVV